MAEARPQTADRVFTGALFYTIALTAFWLFSVLTRREGFFFQHYAFDRESVERVVSVFLFFSILWGLVWYGIKNLLLKRLVGMPKEERRDVMSSRMDRPFDLQGILVRYSERRIRIADMIGRRGRFLMMQMAGFAFLYARISARPTSDFLVLFLQDSLFDAVALSWVALALYYSSGFLGRMFYGAQSRVMDGKLARANCLLITTLWSAFKFVMVPLGVAISARFPPETYAVVFILIWGCYVAADGASEVLGSLFGKQKLKVLGIGEVNRKSWAGTWGGFLAALAVALSVVLSHHLGWPWIALAFVLAASSTLLELFSPRGTDDFTMATGNAFLCLLFGVLVF
jgi:dolichol kinase